MQRAAKKNAMSDASRAFAAGAAMRRVDTRRRSTQAKVVTSPRPTPSFSLVIPESDLAELRTRADGLTTGGSSEHAAMLAAAMRTGRETPPRG